MQADYSDENLVVLYYHVNDPYATTETQARASYYSVGGIPEVDWDSVTEVVNGSTTVRTLYEPIYADRIADPTPVVIRTCGLVKANPDTSWIEATFKAVESVSYGALKAQFVVYEDLSSTLPWTVRDMLPTESVTLSAAGDSVTVRREFVVSTSWNHENVWVATFLEKTVTPKLIVNAQYMREPYGVEVEAASYAQEIPFWGMATFYVTVRNAGAMADSIRLNLTTDFPDSVGPFEWVGIYCDPDGICYMGPKTWYFAPGEEKIFTVDISDYVGNERGLGFATLTATSRSDPSKTADETVGAFVQMPSILIVDDDGGGTYETHLDQAVRDNGFDPWVWDANVEGRPSQPLLDSFWAVLWTTADQDGTSITANDEARMAAYLDGGGNLFLASMGYLSSRTGPTAFTSNYLHIASWTNSTSGFTVTGTPGDAVGDGMVLALLGGPFSPADSESFVLNSPADVSFTAATGDKGLKVAESGHKVVFITFPFEDVKTIDPDPDNQKSLVQRVLHWFGPIWTGVDEGGLPDLARLSIAQNYPNPFNPKTTVAFTVPDGAGRVTLTVVNVKGQIVRTLVDDSLSAGPHMAVWDGTDARGHELASGVYFARLSAGGEVRTTKMALLK